MDRINSTPTLRNNILYKKVGAYCAIRFHNVETQHAELKK